MQQGDPLGPLYFCCGLQPIIDRITALAPTYQKWYLDDGGIVGSRFASQGVGDPQDGWASSWPTPQPHKVRVVLAQCRVLSSVPFDASRAGSHG